MPEYTRPERVKIAQQELQLLDAALRRMGFKYGSIPSREIMEAARYGIAIPTIVRFLRENDLSDMAMDFGSALLTGKCPEIKKAWPEIVELYRNAPVGYGPRVTGDTTVLMYNAKSTLANALKRAYSAKHVPEVLDLVRDPVHGETRLLLFGLLARQRHKENVAAVLEDLADDPLFGDTIRRWAN
ncbi:MAG: hypothetical protein ABJZ56_20090 [Paracoccaceae bacterium]